MRRAFTLIELLVVIAIIAILLGFLTGGGDWVFQVFGHVVLGWPWYLARVLPKLDPDPAEAAVAVVSLGLVTAGVHWFGRWLVPGWRWRWTARAVVLVLLMFVAGTAAVGITHQTGWLLASPEPLLRSRGSLRVAVGRTNSMNNLKQIGIAIHAHHDGNKGHLPASSFTPDGRPLHSWQTELLPFIEEVHRHARIKFDRPWNHPENAEPFAAEIKVFLTSSDAPRTVDGYGASHYAANVLTMGGDRKRTIPGYKQGASYTVLAGEATTNPRAWGDPLNWRDPRLGVNRHPDGFNGPFPGGVNVLMGDGSVRFVTEKSAKGLLDGKFDD